MQTITHYDRSPFLLVYENQPDGNRLSVNELYDFLHHSFSSICISGFSINIIAFGDKKGITLTLDKSSYAPLTIFMEIS